jgi:hypothetical protein
MLYNLSKNNDLDVYSRTMSFPSALNSRIELGGFCATRLAEFAHLQRRAADFHSRVSGLQCWRQSSPVLQVLAVLHVLQVLTGWAEGDPVLPTGTRRKCLLVGDLDHLDRSTLGLQRSLEPC